MSEFPLFCLDIPSLATTPSTTSRTYVDWDPDTPTLKAWAKRELTKSRNELEGRSLESSDEEEEDDNLDTVGGHASKSICTTSLSSKDDEERSPSPENECGEGGPRLQLTRLAYRSAPDGRIYPTYNGMSDSSESDEDSRCERNYQCDEDDVMEDEINEILVERYYHVKDDDSDQDAEEIDEIYDDES